MNRVTNHITPVRPEMVRAAETCNWQESGNWQESIVQEVLRRLQALSPPLGPTASHASLPPSGPTSGSGAHRWTERLLTLDGLRQLPPAISHLLVDPRAVVTPAVFDELRRRNIVLARRPHDVPVDPPTTNRPATSWRWLFASTCRHFRVPVELAQQNWLATRQRESVMAQVNDWVRAPQAVAVVYSQSPALAGCLLNRCTTTLALVVRDRQALDRDLAALSPNVVVIDLHASAAEQLSALQAFRRWLDQPNSIH